MAHALLWGFAAMAFYLVRPSRRSLRVLLLTLSRVRAAMVVQALGILVAVVVASVLLSALPVLSWSWWSLFTASGAIATDTPVAMNVVTAPLWLPYGGPVFLALFIAKVPSLALREEYAFRFGGRGLGWRWITRSSLAFGLAHCVMGVPLGVGLALSFSGWWYAHQYERGGLMHSTASHAVYNWIVCLLLASALVLNVVA